MQTPAGDTPLGMLWLRWCGCGWGARGGALYRSVGFESGKRAFRRELRAPHACHLWLNELLVLGGFLQANLLSDIGSSL